jgi:hypothetical protein
MRGKHREDFLSYMFLSGKNNPVQQVAKWKPCYSPLGAGWFLFN